MRIAGGVAAALIMVTATARADDLGVTPRVWWVGADVGLTLDKHTEHDDEFDFDFEQTDAKFLAGIQFGAQRIQRGTAESFTVDLDPVSGVYRARGAVILGHTFKQTYSEPCAAPAGYGCTRTYGGLDVRSIVGLKLGAEVGTDGDQASTIAEVGLAIRSYLSFDMTFDYDLATQQPGGAFDFAWQIGAFYWGMEVRAIADRDAAPPLVMTGFLGYTPSIKRRR